MLNKWLKYLYKKTIGKAAKLINSVRKVGKMNRDAVVDAVLPRDLNFKKSSRETLKKYEKAVIKKITIFRYALDSKMYKVADIFTLGWFSTAMRKNGFDEFFHLGTILHTDKGDVLYEKNEDINISTSVRIPSASSKITFSISPIVLGEFVANTKSKMGTKRFYDYDAFRNNCQVFIKESLSANGLLTPEYEAFIYQKVEVLYDGLIKKGSNLPFLTKVLTRLKSNINSLMS